MGKFTLANLKKTIYYLQRNGLKNTIHAAAERLGDTEKYRAEIFSEEDRQRLCSQVREELDRWQAMKKEAPTFSILVPAYHTNPLFLRELLQSVSEQAYPLWEILIMDASGDDSVLSVLQEYCRTENLSLDMVDGGSEDVFMQQSVRYIRLAENAGISENTNAGIDYMRGEYIALLDHDDVLTPNALSEMASEIMQGDRPTCVYSDEDKWDGAQEYYELNRKEDFNLDLLLSNNYICHLLVMKSDIFLQLRLRKEYDGAQDYDLVLRAAGLFMKQNQDPEQEFRHVSKVLYHWRCHSASTAENPNSKNYAYEAGRRALQDFADAQGWRAIAQDLKHVGFYRLNYLVCNDGCKEKQAKNSDGAQNHRSMNGNCNPAAILANRSDLGAIGGKLIGHINKGSGCVLIGGRMALNGEVFYEGIKEGYSGYLHRAVLTQDAEAVDLRCIFVSPECRELFERIVGCAYVTFPSEDPHGREGMFDVSSLPAGADIRALSLRFGAALRSSGKRILWDPELIVRV